ncbi:hypothetical protein D0469_02670 [Peribacillus saganii]|uniref:Uncharacterized protein n=2 Tax=Peribacillus saganii TaxID=2303992 RepID=A0A372LSS4_9BACI|nr:hypothetical protein D0469_02670 [Peribacillus saganii]
MAKMSQFFVGVLWGFPSTIILLAVVIIALKNLSLIVYMILFDVVGWVSSLNVQELIVKKLGL